jgi:RNA ligase (TIGR02306 family)
METNERQLVTIEEVADVVAIADADAIEAVRVRGWTVVAKKEQFHVGDRCVYIEIDAALPLSDERFAFLEARSVKTDVDGSRIHVLKTARLRGVYSQGLVLPIEQFPELLAAEPDADLAGLLGVKKYEPPLPPGLGGEMVGAFPTSLARKTDAERAQNLVAIWPLLLAAGPWIATEKLDGTSLTVVNDGGELRVCGRNWELRDGPNVYWDAVRSTGMESHLQPGEVVQAEVYGEGIQANPLRVRGRHVGVFGFFRGLDAVPRNDWPEWVEALAAPVYADLVLPDTVDAALAQVDGLASVVNPQRRSEGVVWARPSGRGLQELEWRSTFKVISNAYLVKQG